MPHKTEAEDQDMERPFEALTQFTTSTTVSDKFATEVLPLNDTRQHAKEFMRAKQNEIKVLKKRGTFFVVERCELPPNANVMGGRFVLSIKNKGTNQESYKARFVVQGHTDSEQNLLIHDGTNLKQSSIRLIAAVAAISGFRIWSQDVTQAYLQSSESLQREIYVRPSKEFNLRDGQLLKLLKPLYGLADAGDYWHATTASHLKQDLCLQPCVADLSLYFKHRDGKLFGIAGSYEDDDLMAGLPDFEREALKTQERFKAREREQDNFTFAGIEINTTDDGFHLHQGSYCKKISPLPEETSFEEFRSKRHQLAWLVHTRPDLAVAVNLAAQATEQSFHCQDVKALNAVIACARKHPKRGILQKRLDQDSLQLYGFADASFASNTDLKSQLGYIALLVDKYNRCSILYSSGCKSRRVTRSVLGAEVYAFADAFHFCFTVREDLSKLLGTTIPLKLFKDSKSLFDIITKCTKTTEKRLMIDVSTVREAYDTNEIDNVGFIRSDQNPADPLTKIKVKSNLNSDS